MEVRVLGYLSMCGGACPRLPEHVWIGGVPFTWPGMCGVYPLPEHACVEVCTLLIT